MKLDMFKLVSEKIGFVNFSESLLQIVKLNSEPLFS